MTTWAPPAGVIAAELIAKAMGPSLEQMISGDLKICESVDRIRKKNTKTLECFVVEHDLMPTIKHFNA